MPSIEQLEEWDPGLRDRLEEQEERYRVVRGDRVIASGLRHEEVMPVLEARINSGLYSLQVYDERGGEGWGGDEWYYDHAT